MDKQKIWQSSQQVWRKSLGFCRRLGAGNMIFFSLVGYVVFLK